MNEKLVKKLIIAAVITGLVVIFKIFNLGQYLTLSYIKDSQQRFQALYSAFPVAVFCSYMFIYILTTSLSLPGAAVLTIAGGALFGLWKGTLIVSFASTIGATLACFTSRYVLRDWIEKKFSERVKKVNEGVEREGAFYLFTLRLIPVFPFWMINILMGLTRMPLLKFYWVSQVGMLPGTLVYVNAGKELGRVESLRGILSPGLIASFVLIGIFPITARKLISFYKAKMGMKDIQD